MQSALVIGGTGLVGRGVVGELAAAGMEVAVVARGQTAGEMAGGEFIRADRTIPGALGEALAGRRFDLVVDCAAYTAADVSEALAAFDQSAGHYFFISSDFVYAADSSARFPLDEDAKKQRDTDYARHKLDAEAVLLNAVRESGFPATILRPPHVLGAGRPPGCDPAAGGRDTTLPARIRAGEEISRLAGGQLLIQPVWSREIGRCIAALAGNAVTFGAIYNLAGAECVTTLCYYEMLAAEMAQPLKMRSVTVEDFVKDNPDKAHLARHRIYDTARLAEAGFRPTLALRDALIETLQWLEPRDPAS